MRRFTHNAKTLKGVKMFKVEVEVHPHEDGVHCGLCPFEDKWVCQIIPQDEIGDIDYQKLDIDKDGETLRSPACLAAEAEWKAKQDS